jgi:Protein of unknown function (DUF664)
MRGGIVASVNDDFVKAHLHQKLREAREALVWKLDGLTEYDIRRPMTATGTNLLGLVKHNAISDSRYFGDVFGRPFPEPLPRWDDPTADFVDHWATAHESRDEIVDLYRRVWTHSDATIETLDLDARGYVPWWLEEVPLFNVMAARLVDAVRHAGHADILREWLDGGVGVDINGLPLHGRDSSYWEARRALIEEVARAAGPPGSA